MEDSENRRKHYNLYYIFAADKQAQLLPGEKAEKIREKIFEKISKT